MMDQRPRRSKLAFMRQIQIRHLFTQPLHPSSLLQKVRNAGFSFLPNINKCDDQRGSACPDGSPVGFWNIFNICRFCSKASFTASIRFPSPQKLQKQSESIIVRPFFSSSSPSPLHPGKFTLPFFSIASKLQRLCALLFHTESVHALSRNGTRDEGGM